MEEIQKLKDQIFNLSLAVDLLKERIEDIKPFSTYLREQQEQDDLEQAMEENE